MEFLPTRIHCQLRLRPSAPSPSCSTLHVWWKEFPVRWPGGQLGSASVSKKKTKLTWMSNLPGCNEMRGTRSKCSILHVHCKLDD